ncbi:MAG TPA: isochorismate synthase [bacterium]|nr:isochorismate synthase [bacterium]
MTVIDQTIHLDPLLQQVKHLNDCSYVQVQIPVAPYDIMDYVSRLDRSNEKFLYWRHPEEDQEFLGVGVTEEFRFQGTDRFQHAGGVFDRLQQDTEVVTGTDTIDIPFVFFGGSFFPEITGSEWASFEPAILYMPEWMIAKKHGTTLLVLNLKLSSMPDLNDIKEKALILLDSLSHAAEFGAPSMQKFQLSLNGEKDTWMTMVQRSLQSIKEHHLEKVVIGSRIRVDLYGQPSLAELLQNLATDYPTCITFALRESGGQIFFGSTPEWLVRTHDTIVHCDALAGSTTRSEDPGEDRALGEALLHDPKNRAEHQYVVEYIRQILQPVATEISVGDTPQLQKLRNVQHIYTPITARTRQGISPFELLAKVHPTPAVGGIPSPDALRFIRDLEDYDRGYFAGPIGWLSTVNTMNMVVGLRSGLLRNDSLLLYAGAGIVRDSIPEEEYKELQLKYQPILSAIRQLAMYD